MMNILMRAWRKATYRTGPGWRRSAQRCDFGVTTSLWGRRTVHDAWVPTRLDARRMQAFRNGFDDVDRALLDDETIELIAATAVRLSAAHQPAANWPART